MAGGYRPSGNTGAGGSSSGNQPQGGSASLADILFAIQNLVVATNDLAKLTADVIPDSTSGQLSADALVQTGFVRVTGISVTTAGAIGTFFDAMNLASSGSTNAIYTVPAAVGFTPVNMVFANGLVYKPGALQVATIFYRRT